MELQTNKTAQYDAIIVGTGAAGLFCALHLPEDVHVLMITKDKLENSDSYLAQGGICCMRDKDDMPSFYEDTMRAGHYENNPDAVKSMIENSEHIIEELMKAGVDFDKKADGDLEFTREGGHSKFRILHHEDMTGKEIVTKLIQRVKERENVEIREYLTMVDLVEENKECHGIVAKDAKDVLEVIYADSVVLATGGLGGLFMHSTNFPHITGDSFAIALKHGVELKNISYIQIHPTGLYSKKPGRCFLISESVRGEGAKLINEAGERFVDELLPRDVVATAIQKEMKKFGTDHVYLNFEDIPNEKILKHFPNIYERCRQEGYDITKEMIPVTPVQHYLMGGILADTDSRTSMKNLYAVGETACNGVHGRNRLASNSLLESLVFAENAAKLISEKNKAGGKQKHSEMSEAERRLKYQQVVSELLGKYDNEEKLEDAHKEIVLAEIKKQGKKFYEQWSNI